MVGGWDGTQNFGSSAKHALSGHAGRGGGLGWVAGGNGPWVHGKQGSMKVLALQVCSPDYAGRRRDLQHASLNTHTPHLLPLPAQVCARNNRLPLQVDHRSGRVTDLVRRQAQQRNSLALPRPSGAGQASSGAPDTDADGGSHSGGANEVHPPPVVVHAVLNPLSKAAQRLAPLIGFLRELLDAEALVLLNPKVIGFLLVLAAVFFKLRKAAKGLLDAEALVVLNPKASGLGGSAVHWAASFKLQTGFCGAAGCRGAGAAQPESAGIILCIVLVLLFVCCAAVFKLRKDVQTGCWRLSGCLLRIVIPSWKLPAT